MSPMALFLIIAVILFSALVFMGILSTRLYQRASKEVCFVRTGFGGQKVVYDGGAFVSPILHQVTSVNMKTLRLTVKRSNEQALITKDRMRVDVTTEFYVRVKPTLEAIADAAQTLGNRTMHPDGLAEHVEAKFVDALRSVAAEMEMEELHEQRVHFVQKVQAAVTEDLLKNGLELESVSLTSLDQTNRDFFNPQNAFDAEGLTKLTAEIEARRKKRNAIERDTQIEVQKKNLEAERITLEQKKEEEYARLVQEREIAARRAEEAAETCKIQAENKRLGEEAQIEAEQKVNQAMIESEKRLEEEKIKKARALKYAEIEKEKAIKLAEQEREIAISEKSEAQSMALASAEKARANAVKAAEEVATIRESEIANRKKQIELIEARKQAEREAIAVTVAAEAEKKASEDRAKATHISAEAEAGKERIIAKGESDAKLLQAEAVKAEYLAEAEGKKALHEAENLLSSEIISMKIKQAIIEHLSDIINASVKPIEAISDIKILQVNGLNGGSMSHHETNGTSGNQNLADQMVNSALRYRSQAPLVDAILKEIGINGGDINGLTDSVKDSLVQQVHAPQARDKSRKH